MKKSVLSFVFLTLATLVAFAQTPCTPNNRYKDSTAGVYPLPFVAVTNPTGGINVPACLGKAYSFVWTVKITDSVTVPNPLGAGTITTAIDSVTLPTTGAIQNLPVGITYACNPPNCVFKKNSMGCVALSGTPAASNAIKVYKLIISGKVFGPLVQLLYPSGYPLTFPGAIAEGEYNLNVYANGDTRCNVSTKELSEVSNISATPNPTSGTTVIRFDAQVNGEFQFTLRNSMGQEVMSTPLSINVGLNAFDINAQDLPNGVYYYSISKGQFLTSQKLVVNH
jgi:Secretion system C-terminal sorting domain